MIKVFRNSVDCLPNARDIKNVWKHSKLAAAEFERSSNSVSLQAANKGDEFIKVASAATNVGRMPSIEEVASECRMSKNSIYPLF